MTATVEINTTSTVNALMTLIKPLGHDIKTALLERLQRMVKTEEKTENKTKLFEELCGVWADDGLTADEEIEMLRSSRTFGITRHIEEL